MIQYNPNCPHCGVELDFFDHNDLIDDGDILLIVARGTCPECKRRYTWNDVYTLTGFQDLEEDEWP